MIIKTTLQLEEDRRDEFAAWTKKIMADEVVLLPLYLKKNDRRIYVRKTLREDHTYRIKSSPEDTQQKFDKLASSSYSFFRGTALLYYRDYAGLDQNNDDQNKKAQKIVEAHDIHLVGGDALYGFATYQDKSYLIRERSPYKHDLDIDELDAEKLEKYARLCGKTLSQTHARSDEDTGTMEGNAEDTILQSIITKVFVEDMVRFAKLSAKRVIKDFELFKLEYQLGAFDFMGN